MQNSNMIISIFMFYYQKKGIPSENPFLFRKELKVNCEPQHAIFNNVVHVYVQLAKSQFNLHIRAVYREPFAGHMNILWVLSY